MCGNCNGTVKQCKVTEESMYHPQYVLCDTAFVTYIYCYMFRQRCHPQGVIIPKVYNQHNNIYSTPPNKLLIYAINGVSHSACVGWYIDCKNMYSVNSRKFHVIRSQHSAAVHCCLQHTQPDSSTARCVLLFNGDVSGQMSLEHIRITF